MNKSLYFIHGLTKASKKIRDLSGYLNEVAEKIDSARSLSGLQREVLKKNSKFFQKHKGKPGFVIVNGPSLASQNILPLKDSITFVVSGFWKHEATLNWQPTYYSLLDANFFVDTPATREFYQKMHERIRDSEFFVPLFRGFDAVERFKYLPPERTSYVASIGGKVLRNDLTDIVQSFAGVSAFALSQAIYMGCNPIYLLGFDHDYLANRGVDRHFYSGGTLPGHNATNIPLGERIPYDDEMRANLKLWENYRILDAIAKKEGIKIYNATRGGYLDVFPRIDFDALFQQ